MATAVPTPDIRATVLAEVSATATASAVATSVGADTLATATALVEAAQGNGGVCNRGATTDLSLLLGVGALLGLLVWRRTGG
jgi:hypothetical protein